MFVLGSWNTAKKEEQQREVETVRVERKSLHIMVDKIDLVQF